MHNDSLHATSNSLNLFVLNIFHICTLNILTHFTHPFNLVENHPTYFILIIRYCPI